MDEISPSLYMEAALGQGVLNIALLDNPVAKKVFQALPLQASAKLWGDEMYLSTELPIVAGELQEVVEVGDVCWWAPGSALCFFWGPTPASLDEECRPASAVTVIGKISGEDLTLLRELKEGDPVVVKKKKQPAMAAIHQQNGQEEHHP